MRAEKFFCGESSTFQFAFWALLPVLYGVSCSVYFRFVVRFCMVCGACARGKHMLVEMPTTCHY
jgi:hypothetical protein